MRRPKEVAVKAVHSRLFSSLDSTWRFRPGNAPNTTLIDFSVEFEVKNLLAAQAMDVFFDEVALQQVMEKTATGAEVEADGQTTENERRACTVLSVWLTNSKYVFRTVPMGRVGETRLQLHQQSAVVMNLGGFHALESCSRVLQ